MSTENRPALGRLRDGNPFHKLLEIEVEDASTGYARIKLPMAERLKGGVGGSLHGGVLSALVDIAALGAMTSVFTPNEQAAGTAELNISYLRPALGSHVIAEARVLKKGRALAVIDVDITSPDGKLVAKGRVSYALRQRS